MTSARSRVRRDEGLWRVRSTTFWVGAGGVGAVGVLSLGLAHALPGHGSAQAGGSPATAPSGSSTGASSVPASGSAPVSQPDPQSLQAPSGSPAAAPVATLPPAPAPAPRIVSGAS